MPNLPAIGSANWGLPLDNWLFAAHNTDGTPNSLSGLIPTAVKTANYTASVGDLVPCDISGGSFTITLPTAPTDRTRIAVKIIAAPGNNTLTIAAGGSDVFNRSSGPTTLTLKTQYEAYHLQYFASTGIWYADDGLHLSSLDGRYVQQGSIVVNVKDYGAKGDGTTDDTTAIQNAINANTGALVVFFPYAGSGYLISSSLIIDRDEVALVGEGGCFATQIAIAGTADPTFALIVGNTKTVKFCSVRNLTFKGRKDATTTGKGIQWYCARGIVENVYIEQFGGSGFVVGGFSTDHINDHYMIDVYIEQCGYNPSTNGDGLVIQSGCYDSEYMRVICCGDGARGTTRDGFNNSGVNQKFVACHTFYCSRYGFNHLNGPLEMVAGASETNVNDNMQINGVNDFSVSDMQFYCNSTYGTQAHKDLSLITATRGTISDCRFTTVTTDKNVFIGTASQIVIFSDNITENGANGIQIDSTCTRIIVHDNQIQSTGDSLVAGTYVNFHHNTMISCGIAEQTGANNNKINHNILYTAGKTITKVGANTTIRTNQGFVTEAHGNANITTGNTTVVVTHGLALTPSLEQISITPQTSLGNAHFFWISNATSTQFTVNLDVNPGATVTFGWKAEVGY